MGKGRNHQFKRKDPNDPQWLMRQMCWACRRIGHIRQRYMASWAEREAYREKKAAEHDAANAHAVVDELEVYAKAMLVQDIEGDESEVHASAMVALAIDDDE